ARSGYGQGFSVSGSHRAHCACAESQRIPRIPKQGIPWSLAIFQIPGPRGFHPKARGRDERSTPGNGSANAPADRNAVASLAVVPDATRWDGVFAALVLLRIAAAGAAGGIESAAAARRTPGRFARPQAMGSSPYF